MRSRLIVLPILLSALFASGCPEVPDVRYRRDLPEGKRPAGTQAGYVRYTGAAPDIAGDLETLVRRFERADGGPSILLVGAIHFGDEAYFAELQRILEGEERVLFEAVKPAGEPMPPPAVAQAQLAGPVRKVSELMGVRYQLAAIDYTRPSFVWADMDAGTFGARVRDKIATTRDEALRAVLGDVGERIFGGGDRDRDEYGRERARPRTPEPKGDDEREDGDEDREPPAKKRERREFFFRGALAGALLPPLRPASILPPFRPARQDGVWDLVFLPLELEKRRYEQEGRGKAFEDKYKHFYALSLASPEADLEASLENLRRRSEREQDLLAKTAVNLLLGIWSIVLEERNEIVIGAVRDALASEKRPRSIAIFYGAAHMPLFEKQLAALGYRPSLEERWVKAWAMDTIRGAK